LGNPSANALPTSRLKELQGYLSALEAKTEPKSVDGTQDCEGNDLYLWIDTLCVPLDKRIRKIALLRINAAYAKSRFVLVLDTSLKYISCKTINAELALRVYSSRWMQRLWTLSEGVLAQRLCFQFLDGSVTLDDLKPPLQASWDQIFVSQLHCQAFRPLMVFRRIRILPPSERFDILWNASTYRSTSKKHDEPIILGIIAGFGEIHMSRIVHAPDLKRMEVFFSCWNSLPARIIFTAGQHLTTNGYGWAVESLLNKGDLAAYDHPKSDGRDDLTACRVPEALVVCAAGYLLKENVYRLPEEFQVMNEDNAQTISVEQEPNKRLARPEGSKFLQSAIILSHPQLTKIDGSRFAALVAISGQENGTIYCEWHCRIWISRSIRNATQGTRDPSGIHAAFSSCSVEEVTLWEGVGSPVRPCGESKNIRAESIREDQKWCIA
jgi:hypothetical protein